MKKNILKPCRFFSVFKILWFRPFTAGRFQGFALAAAALFVFSTLNSCAAGEGKIMKNTEYGNRNESERILTPFEFSVIKEKNTEAPFSGEYWNSYDEGTYLCKNCLYPLFRSSDKFDSGCGWPAFDDQFENRVREVPDPDGTRTEIICANCGAHLGHVFRGEGFTEKNLRHCVNSISVEFVPALVDKPLEKAVFASGCFWGTEYMFENLEGVVSAVSGYTGGHKENPAYKEVSTGKTGHAEAVEVFYDPGVVSYEELVIYFFNTHDPTQVNRQGPDFGSQYRSALFYLTEGQKKTAEKVIRRLEEKGLKIATELTAASRFWKAEEYHQDYYRKKGGEPYCHFFLERFGN